MRKPKRTNQENIEFEDVVIAYANELNFEIRSLINELHSVGIEIISIWDLVNTSQRYPQAIPVLLKHLPLNYQGRNKEGIVRALCVRKAKKIACPALIAEYLKTSKDKMDLRWAIGNSVYMTFAKEYLKDIIPIVLDKTNGMSRGRFIEALGKVKTEQTELLLISLLNEDDFDTLVDAVKTLGKLKSKKAKEKIISLINYPHDEVRRQVKKALLKIG